MVTQAHTVNGVDVDRLMETVEVLRQKGDLGEFHFRVHNRWLGRGRNQSEIMGFYGAGEEHHHEETTVLYNDEPEVLLGEGSAPNPVEHLLHALAGCLTTTMVFHAAARGIEIESVESELEGDLDIRGFLGLTNDVPRGYQRIRVNFKVKSDAPREKLEELAKYSPVFNTIVNATPVDVTVTKM